ncbi:hypothetical protein [Sulfurimonas sp.]
MKTISLSLLIFFTTNLCASNNWIKIEPTNKTQIIKSKTKLDVNLSQIKPIDKMMKRVSVIKQLVDLTSKKEKVSTNEKNWFILDNKTN